MTSLIHLLGSLSTVPIPILDATIPIAAYTPLNLSIENAALEGINIVDPIVCQAYIDSVLSKNKALVAFGGYLEKRNLYADKSSFSEKAIRNTHLGVDYWAKAGTKVRVPIDGVVHSFQNNAAIGDYGPTIILKHEIEQISFHTLYGHLSLASLEELYLGKPFLKGETLAKLGTTAINVNYAAHLHFQVIYDMEGKSGDYPGVCSEKHLSYYAQNCPNPNFLLKIASC